MVKGLLDSLREPGLRTAALPPSTRFGTISHSAPKLVQPSPGRLVAAQAQHPLQSQCTRPVLLAGEPPHCSKPTLERLAGVLKDCACCRRSLMPAACTLQQHRAHRPGFVMPASRTTKTLRPAELTQILPTGLLASETRLELGQIPGIIFHRPRSYILGSPESSKYPSSAKTRRRFR